MQHCWLFRTQNKKKQKHASYAFTATIQKLAFPQLLHTRCVAECSLQNTCTCKRHSRAPAAVHTGSQLSVHKNLRSGTPPRTDPRFVPERTVRSLSGMSTFRGTRSHVLCGTLWYFVVLCKPPCVSYDRLKKFFLCFCKKTFAYSPCTPSHSCL